MSSPTREGAVIADDLTYIGQTQIVGGTANTSTPPTVNVGTIPAVTISSAQIVGGSLNAATPPYSIPVNQAVGAGVSQRTVAPSFVPIGLEGAGHTNANNPPLMQTLGSSGAVAPSSIQPVGAGAGTDNSTNQPRVQTIGGDATFPSSAQPVGGALNTATPPAQVPMRPSQLASGTRTYKAVQATGTGVGNITVSVAPKKFYVTSVVFSAVVTGAEATALKIVDTAGNGDLIPFVAPVPGATLNQAGQSTVGYSMSFQEPLQFTATPQVVAVGAGATVKWACALVGYTE